MASWRPTMSTPSWPRPGALPPTMIAPLNAVGDKHGTPFKDGAVTTPPGWKDGLYAPGRPPAGTGSPGRRHSAGQALPRALNAACIEMWMAASPPSASARC